MDHSNQTPEFHRKIRSFVRREGRFTPGQQRAFDLHWKDFGLDFKQAVIEPEALFGRNAPLILEIGFGNGDSLAAMAEKNPQNNYLGIEVHRPGAGQLLHQIEQRNLDNLRISTHDAVEVLIHQLQDESLQGVQIFFPDPWPKKRHHKRRIIQNEFMTLLAKKLKLGGFVHMATDWENYAEHMLEVMQAHTDYKNTAETFISRPEYRPLTKFEQRGLKLGHEIFDLMFVKI